MVVARRRPRNSMVFVTVNLEKRLRGDGSQAAHRT
jgi:hypothetical protein